MKKSRRRTHRKYKKKQKKVEPILFVTIIILVILFTIGLQGDALMHTALLIFLIVALCLLLVILFFLLKSIGKEIKKQLKELEHFKNASHLEDFRAMSPEQFEHYVAWIFAQQGYIAKVTQAGGDHGIDVYLKKDKGRYAVQVKRYKEGNRVGEPEVRNFFGSFFAEGITHGFFVTSGSFTDKAVEWVKEKKDVSIILIDGNDLANIARKIKEPRL